MNTSIDSNVVSITGQGWQRLDLRSSSCFERSVNSGDGEGAIQWILFCRKQRTGCRKRKTPCDFGSPISEEHAAF